jgi:hypothetical protein
VEVTGNQHDPLVYNDPLILIGKAFHSCAILVAGQTRIVRTSGTVQILMCQGCRFLMSMTQGQTHVIVLQLPSRPSRCPDAYAQLHRCNPHSHAWNGHQVVCGQFDSRRPGPKQGPPVWRVFLVRLSLASMEPCCCCRDWRARNFRRQVSQRVMPRDVGASFQYACTLWRQVKAGHQPVDSRCSLFALSVRVDKLAAQMLSVFLSVYIF